jgi:hypothetical protein
LAFGYAPVSGDRQPQDRGSNALAWSLVTAPLFGSRLLFPRRFDAAVAALVRDPHADRILPPYHAFWYFGSSLRLWVDPAGLKCRLSDFVSDERGVRWIGSSFLDGAVWRDALAPLSSSPIHREMVELVNAGLNFRETRAYGVLRTKAEKGRPHFRNGIALANADQIDGYFRYCAELVASIREHGVVERREMPRLRSLFSGHRGARPRYLDGTERDIGVAINANGMLVRHLGGKHRTAAAQALELPVIPVEVRLVHVRWLARQMGRTGLPAHLALVAGLESLAARLAGPS